MVIGNIFCHRFMDRRMVDGWMVVRQNICSIFHYKALHSISQYFAILHYKTLYGISQYFCHVFIDRWMVDGWMVVRQSICPIFHYKALHGISQYFAILH